MMNRTKDMILFGILAGSTAGFVMSASAMTRPAAQTIPVDGLAQHAAVLLSGLFHPAALLILVLGAALYLHAVGRRKLALVTIGAVLFTAALTVALKYFFGTARPDFGLVPAAGPSFPSAHAAVSVITAILFAYAFSVLHKGQRTERVVGIVLGALAGLVAWSRLALGVHWPHDVWAGIFLGTAVASAALLLYAHIHVSRSKNS